MVKRYVDEIFIFTKLHLFPSLYINNVIEEKNKIIIHGLLFISLSAMATETVSIHENGKIKFEHSGCSRDEKPVISLKDNIVKASCSPKYCLMEEVIVNERIKHAIYLYSTEQLEKKLD